MARKFPTTNWSLIVAATRGRTPVSEEALASLCETYWGPLYSFVRGRGYSAEDAQDLSQGFFARFLEKQSLKDVRQEQGKFRSFLLASLKHFLADEWDNKPGSKTRRRQGSSLTRFCFRRGMLEIQPIHRPFSGGTLRAEMGSHGRGRESAAVA